MAFRPEMDRRRLARHRPGLHAGIDPRAVAGSGDGRIELFPLRQHGRVRPVQPRSRRRRGRTTRDEKSRAQEMQPGGMGLMGPRPSLGLIRGQLTPLSPISSRGMGAGEGMGSMGGLIRRTPSGGPMGGMARPPVGSYPFRQPPSLLGPATAAPSMAM